MKLIRYVLFILLFAIPSLVLAQNSMPASIDIVDALEVLRSEYGEDVQILKAEFETNDDDDDHSEDDGICWEFTILDTEDVILNVYVCTNTETDELILTLVDDDSLTDDDSDDDHDSETEYDDDSWYDDDGVLIIPTITVDEAIEIALEIYPDATITGIELENEDGTLVWDFDIDDDIRSVDIDAISGVVVQFGYENNDDDRNNNYDDHNDDDDDHNDSDDHSDDNDDDDDDDHHDDDDDDHHDDDDDDD